MRGPQRRKRSGSARNARLWAGDARAARPRVLEDRLARAGGAVMPNIVKGDTVLIRRGKERGKRGVVKAIFPRAGMATVEGLNVVKRHTKPGAPKQQNMGGSSQSGGILEK